MRPCAAGISHLHQGLECEFHGFKDGFVLELERLVDAHQEPQGRPGRVVARGGDVAAFFGFGIDSVGDPGTEARIKLDRVIPVAGAKLATNRGVGRPRAASR